MPLYRTNSDRGLWKKYRQQQPQHFHKSCYLKLDKNTPQVTYSQLDLGGDEQYCSSRQSNPSNHHRRFKSAPTTPRANSPTNTYTRSRLRSIMSDREPYIPPASVGHERPLTATSVYSQDTTFSGYPAENASSYDSRSLGRDSALEPYMSANYSRNGFHAQPLSPDRPNPFVEGSSVAAEADNVVQMFLMNMNVSRRPPGRIEDLPSPLDANDGGGANGHHADDTSSDDRPEARPVAHKTVISQMRHEFLNKDFPQSYEKTEPAPKTNKYLKAENRWSKPPLATSEVVQGFVAPQMHHAEVVHVRHDSTSEDEASSTATPVTVERSFEDPAFSQFKAEQSSDMSPTKKKNFLSSLFKKSSNNSRKQKNRSFEDDNDDQIDMPNRSFDDHDEPVEMPKLLPRKRSMSKPTDLDEILRMQEEMEKEQTVEQVFANDPFFQSTLNEYNIRISPNPPPDIPSRYPIERNVPIVQKDDSEHIYENHHHHHQPSMMDTTQEIDIDALLGYSDEKAIDNIEWPTQDDPIAPNDLQEPPNQVEIDYAQPQKTKRGFFSFGKKANKKKAGKNDEVSYYIEEPQPEPPKTEPPQEAYESDDAKRLDNNSLHDQSLSKPSFFKSFGKRDKSPKSDQEVSKPSSFFKRKNKPPQQYFEDEQLPPEEELEATTPKEDNIDHQGPAEATDELANKENLAENIELKEEKWEPEKSSKPSFFKRRTKSQSQDESFEAEVTSVNNKSREKPSFFKRKAGKQPPSPKFEDFEPVNGENHEEEIVVAQEEMSAKEEMKIEDDQHSLGPIREEKPSFVTETSKADTSDSEASRRGGKRGGKFSGFSSLFKSQNKDNQRRTPPRQIGTMAPVDISHLVDADEAVQAEIDQEDVKERASNPDRSMDSLPRRGRQRQKSTSSGFASFFGPPKPRSRPSSQTRQQDQFSRDNRRARSMPRSRSAPKVGGGGGLSDFFNAKQEPVQKSLEAEDVSQQPNEPQEAPKQEDMVVEPRQETMPEIVQEDLIAETEQVVRPEPINNPRRMAPPQKKPPKSKSLGGFFSMQPKHQPPRRPVAPPPDPPEDRRALSNSSSSLASARSRKESKGLSNFLGASPLRQSNRMPRSQTFPAPRQDPVPVAAAPPSQQDNNPDQIEVAPEQPRPQEMVEQPAAPRPQAQSGDPRRVQGRQSGRFRRQQGNQQPVPSQLKGPHQVPPASTAAAPSSNITEHSMTRDIFAEAVNRPSRGPSRRGSMTSLNQPKDFVPADSEYDQAVSKGMGDQNEMPRNENNRRSSKGFSAMRNYNSLPRMGQNRQRQPAPPQQQQQQQQRQMDPETRSLGEQRQRGARRNQQRGGNDNCQMM